MEEKLKKLYMQIEELKNDDRTNLAKKYEDTIAFDTTDIDKELIIKNINASIDGIDDIFWMHEDYLSEQITPTTISNELYVKYKNTFEIPFFQLENNLHHCLIYLQGLINSDYENNLFYIMQCYIKSKSMCKEIEQYICKYMELASNIQSILNEEQNLVENSKEYKELFKNVTLQRARLFEEVIYNFNVDYNYAYNEICSIGDFIFVYLRVCEKDFVMPNGIRETSNEQPTETITNAKS